MLHIDQEHKWSTCKEASSILFGHAIQGINIKKESGTVHCITLATEHVDGFVKSMGMGETSNVCMAGTPTVVDDGTATVGCLIDLHPTLPRVMTKSERGWPVIERISPTLVNILMPVECL